MGRHNAFAPNGCNLLIAGLVVLAAFFSQPLRAETGYPAPNWRVKTWINTEPVHLSRLRGKIVVLEFFQMDCHLCEDFTLPVLERWYRLFSEEIRLGQMVFVSIHSVPELALYQTEPRLRRFIRSRGIRRAVGIDLNRYGHQRPETMRRYNISEIPVMVFIDKRGDVRFRKTGRFSAHVAEKYLRQLLAE